jgi:hypothetical protein
MYHVFEKKLCGDGVQKTKKLPQHGAAGVFLLGLLCIAMD